MPRRAKNAVLRNLAAAGRKGADRGESLAASSMRHVLLRVALTSVENAVLARASFEVSRSGRRAIEGNGLCSGLGGRFFHGRVGHVCVVMESGKGCFGGLTLSWIDAGSVPPEVSSLQKGFLRLRNFFS